LDNLFVIVDYNKLQAFGRTNQVLNLEPLSQKWRNFNFDVYEIDGHDFKQILKSLKKAISKKSRPHVIICHTIKGKGISFAEDKLEWHYFNLNKELYEKAKRDIYRGIN
jgi:transketolase